MATKSEHPIPPGFIWSHIYDTYVHPDGRRWDSDTNTMYDKYGTPCPSKPTIDDIERQINEGRNPKIRPDGAVILDETIEEEIVRKGLTAPRVTPANIDAAILTEQFDVPVGTVLTRCVLTLQNGFTVTGESACASPENFDADIGKRAAREDAKRKIWPLLGYALREKLSKENQS